MGYVYALIGPTGKAYIGKTVHKNLRTYLNRCGNEALHGRKDSKPKLYRAFRKHGLQNFRAHKLVESDDNSVLCAWEKYYIKDWMSIQYGYNISSGGEGAGYKHRPDCKHCLWIRTVGAALLRESQKKRVYPPKKPKVLKGWSPEQRQAAADRARKQLADNPEQLKLMNSLGGVTRWAGHIKKTPPPPKSPEEIRRNIKRQGSSSQFVGVMWEPSRSKWKAAIFCNKKRHILGRFENEIDAAIAYNDAAKRLLNIGPVNIIGIPNVIPNGRQSPRELFPTERLPT